MFAIKLMLVAVGTLVILLAAVGVVRMPDVYSRMSASAKAATLGIILLLIAVALHFQETSVTTRVVATIAFVLLTAPVGAQMMGRAAYARQTPLWEGTVADEFRRDLEAAGDHTAREELSEQMKVDETLR